MGSTNYEDAVVVAVRGDAGAHADQVFARTVGEVCDALGLTAEERRTLVEHPADLEGCFMRASTPSMFAERRVVAFDDTVDTATLRRLVEEAGGSAVVVTRCGSRATPKPGAGLVVVDARAPRTEGDRRAHLEAAVTRTGVRLDPHAAEVLLDRTGAESASLDATLTGLARLAGGEVVTAEMVDALVDEAATAAPFAFVDSIEAGDIAGSLEHLARLAGPSGWAPLRTLGLLRNRWMGAWRIAEGAPVPDGFAGRHLANLARRLGPTRLAAGVAHIAAAEAAAKGGSRLEPQALVEVCVARLARLARDAGARRAR